MTYPYPHRTRPIHREVHSHSFTGSCSAGTATDTVNLLAGALVVGVSLEVSNTDKTVVLTAQPWSDHAQSVLADTSFKLLKVGASTATTNLTMAATATGDLGSVAVLIPAGDQYGAAAPIVIQHGMQFTVATTATTGTWRLTYEEVEM